ncbi:rhoptry protein, partial [Trypanosoma theileri]
LQAENGELQNKNVALYSDNVELRGGNESLKSVLFKDDNERAKLAVELEKVRGEHVVVLKELAVSRDSFLSLQSEKKEVEDELNDKINFLEGEVATLKAINCEAEYAVAMEKKRKLEAVLEVEKERERSAELVVLCDKLSSESRAADDEIERLQHAVSDYEVRLDVVRPNVDVKNKYMEREGYTVYPILNKGRTTIGRSGVPLGLYRD